MKSLLSVVFLMFFLTAYGQQTTTIYGKITDEQNRPVPYVSVAVKGTPQGVLSGDDGTYTLSIVKPGSYTLRYSKIGYTTVTREVRLTGQETLEAAVTLTASAEALDQVVITSNRTRETLDEVPSSVSVVSAEEIENLAQTSTTIADVLMEIPGMALSTNQTSNTGQTLRGRKMLILIDGIPQSTPLRSGSRDVNTIDPSTLERIEVIKGATAIYGNGADGGIVNYITKKPAAEDNFESTTHLATTGALKDMDHTIGTKITQTFSGKLNKLGYVASGGFQQTGVFRDAGGEVISPYYGIGETNQYSLFGKLNYEITGKHRIEFMYNYFSSNQNSDYVAQVGVFGETPTIGIFGQDPGADQGNRYNHNAQLTYDFTGIFGRSDFRLNLYMQDFKTVYGFTDSFYDPEKGFEGGQSSIISAKKGARFNFKTPYELGNLDGNILYGIDVLNDKTAQELVDGRPWVPEMDMKNFAPYAQLKVLYSDFVIKAGIRFENINIQVPDYTTLVRYEPGEQTPNSGGVAVKGGELDYTATTFNAGLRYSRWDVFKPFISFSQSFSIADLGRTLRSATENTISQINSEAVIANNYEIGFSSHFKDTRLSGAYFISTSDFGATYRELPGGAFEITRQPERVYGFELALDRTIASGLHFGGSVSYTEGKLDAEDNGNYDTYMNGDRIPPLKTVAYLSYRWADRLDARVSYIYSGNRDHFSPDENGDYSYGQGPVSAVNLVNLTAGYQLSPTTRIGLGIENLLNTDYYNLFSQWAARDSDYIKANGARFNLSLEVNL